MTYPSRRRSDAVNKIFGEELPRVTSDERDVDASRDDAEREQWLRENVPPHHE